MSIFAISPALAQTAPPISEKDARAYLRRLVELRDAEVARREAANKAKLEAAKPDPVKPDPGEPDPGESDPGESDPLKSDPVLHDPVPADTLPDPVKPDPDAPLYRAEQRSELATSAKTDEEENKLPPETVSAQSPKPSQRPVRAGSPLEIKKAPGHSIHKPPPRVVVLEVPAPARVLPAGPLLTEKPASKRRVPFRRTGPRTRR
ncbi:MAG: hypothetical protein VCA37_10395 [Roseibacillus sp.]